MLQRHQFEAQGNGNLQMRQKYCLKVYFFTYSSTGLIYISFINHGTHPRLKVEHLDQRELNLFLQVCWLLHVYESDFKRWVDAKIHLLIVV